MHRSERYEKPLTLKHLHKFEMFLKVLGVLIMSTIDLLVSNINSRIQTQAIIYYHMGCLEP